MKQKLKLAKGKFELLHVLEFCTETSCLYAYKLRKVGCPVKTDFAHILLNEHTKQREQSTLLHNK